MEEETPENHGFSIFGKDISMIPCFRKSWLFGISSGIGGGLLYFLFTSKPKMSSHVGFGTMLGVTASYWVVCRYSLHRQVQEIQRMKEYVQKKVLMEGSEMEKLHGTEAVDVSHTKVDV